MRYSTIESPLGKLLLAGNEGGLRRIHFDLPGGPAAPAAQWRRDDAFLSPVREQLEEYFSGVRREFDLTLAPEGTEFQLRVWRELERIGYGETISYGKLARRLGNPQASRAVGLANGANPLPIVIPCHRVIGSDGRLTGYGGGIDNKRFLLRLERASAVGSGDQAELF